MSRLLSGGVDLAVDQPATVVGGLGNVAVATTTAIGTNLVGSTVAGGSATLPLFNTNSPLLGPLADNGGPTQTMALLEGSPAIDAATGGTPPSVDQRGLGRPAGTAPDVGAFELGATGTAPQITSSAPPNGSFGVSYNHTVVATGAPVPSFSISAGSLPPGLTLDAGSGVISGIPSSVGVSSGTVSASNGIGAAATQNFEISITAVAPGPPTGVVATRGNASVSVSFVSPVNTGGSAISSYEATCGTQSASGTAAPIVVTNLSNGVAVTCTVIATNAAGSSVPSAASNSVTPATIPGVPTNLAATPGEGSASFQFSPPASNGGAAIIDYTVTCAPGNRQVTGTGSPLTLSGLTNGTTYTCSVRARNEVGSGAASATIDVTPGGAVAITSAPLPAGSFGVAYSHTVTASGSPAPTFSISAGSLPAGLTLDAISGVVSGTPVSVGTSTGTITASNGVGTPATQNFSVSIAAVAPGAPTGVVATRGNASVSVSFVAPVNTGGVAIDSYEATCGGQSASGVAAPIIVGNLVNGVAVTCTVSATNIAGTSAPSAPSNSVTPATVPGAPAITAATPGNGSASFQFTPPASDGGSAIIDYTVLCSPGNGQVSGANSPLTLSGLSNGTTYACTVTARNDVGSGMASAPANVTPSGGASTADLSITKSNDSGFVTGGATTSYLIVVSNAGPSAVSGARVADVLGPDFSNASWTCVGQNGGSCAAGGTGNLDELVDLPAGASVRFTLTALVAVLPETPVSNLASVTAPGPVTDPNLANNVASDGPDVRGIFRSGF